MRYVLSTSTILCIVENPEIKSGIIYATKIAEKSEWVLPGEEPSFEKCSPKKIIAGGGPWVLTEYDGQ